ncbi:MAG: M48 family metalloprotease [Candidatus Angelobacter sp.]
MRFPKALLFIAALMFGVCCRIAPAQSGANPRIAAGPCSVPAYDSILREPNIFNEQQEEWLGEILAPQVENAFRIIPDPESDYLQKLADKLLAQLPQSNIHYRLTIIDLPENNSFGIPGGHIYISRRIIALVKNEDELAGLVGHEIGHIITRQPAIDLTSVLQKILGVNRLGDRKDVETQWNRLLDQAATQRWTDNRKREEAEQLIADRIAIYAMSRAGYQPSKFVEFFDRLAQTKGNKGSFWTDLFGRTSNDAKRLRELVRTAVPQGQSCYVPAAGNVMTERFLKWQGEVIESEFALKKEALPGLLSKQVLNPPLRSDLRQLQFSPNRKYLLAQDENSIYVMSADPVTNLFRVDAADSYAAHFTPDSLAVVFYDKELRVQKWNMEGKRLFIRELALPIRCVETALSHSGEVLACMDEQLQPELIDVNTNAVIYKGKKLQQQTRIEAMLAHYTPRPDESGRFAMHFSSGDHYFVAEYEKIIFAYDVKNRIEVTVGPAFRDFVGASFCFNADDEVVGYGFVNHQLAILRARFPSGQILDSMPGIAMGRLTQPQPHDYVLIRQDTEPVIRVVDWKTKTTLFRNKKPGFDIYGDTFASETAGGEVGIYSVLGRQYKGGIDLPNGPISFTTASAFSSNNKWLAVSQNSRGGVWNIDTGERVFLTRGFQGAFFDDDQLFAKFPKQGSESAAIFKMDAGSQKIQSLYELKMDGDIWAYGNPGAFYWQQGDFLLRGSRVEEKTNKKVENRFMVEVMDVRSNKRLWQRKPARVLPMVLRSAAGKTMTFVIGDYEDMKAEAREDAVLSRKLDALANEKRRAASYIIEVFEDSTGKPVGKILVDTGNLSFKIFAARTVGDNVLVTDSDGRTLIYSLKTGEQKAAFYGRVRALSSDGSEMVLDNEKGKADIYSLSDLRLLSHLEFPFPLVHAEFSGKGDSLRVLTSDQTIYKLKVETPVAMR